MGFRKHHDVRPYVRASLRRISLVIITIITLFFKDYETNQIYYIIRKEPVNMELDLANYCFVFVCLSPGSLFLSKPKTTRTKDLPDLKKKKPLNNKT